MRCAAFTRVGAWGRIACLGPAFACLALAALAPAAWAAPSFRPRIGGALGVEPPVNRQGEFSAHDVATGALTPVTYHAGPTMTGGVTVHTIFWAPPGFPFQGQPAGAPADYEGLLQQFFTDVAHDSSPLATGTCTTSECNIFTVENQYGFGTSPGAITPGDYAIGYSAAADSIDDSDPYPPVSQQCASPSGVSACITDGQVQAEIDKLAPTNERGLTNLWAVFLPPNVDECILPNNCGTNAFAAYHSVFDLNGHGATIYAVAIDPIIEAPIPPGADPEGFPDAETTIDAIAHETNEAMSDPEGTGWMDPNGLEIADKCETGPQLGTPLGFAPDGSPYNQVINGHQYLIQEIWSNADGSCVQATTKTNNALPLPQVNLRQFDSIVTGNVNRAPGGGIGVQVSLLREAAAGGPVVVARATTTTAADGSWSVSLAPHAVGDDRDEIDIDYSGATAPEPHHQVILTGNGGSPFNEAGWTGWLDLDNGSLAGGSALTLAPCFQTGTLSFTFNGAGSAQSPNDLCNTQTTAATVSTPAIGPADTLKVTSNDNRAFDAPGAPTPNLLGGLVSLTVPVGEPGSVSAFTSPLTTFTQGGFPSCTADLELDAVQCIGLVPGRTYTLVDGRQRASAIADATGTAIAPLAIRRGDAIALSNGSRTLTTLHVAHLQVRIFGEETVVAGGTCQPGDYFGAPVSKSSSSTSAGLPTSTATGGAALTGEVCPLNGRAAGLPSTAIAQTDDLSGGETETEVPDVEDTSPMEGETVYGRFTALAESGLTLPGNEILPTDAFTRIAMRIVTAAEGATAFTARNVDTVGGVSVPALRPGAYDVLWTLTDGNGDTRLVGTRFIEQLGRIGPGPRARVACGLTGGSPAAVRCGVTYGNGKRIKGTLQLRLTRGRTVVALGHGRVTKGKAAITARELSQLGSGPWLVTLVLSEPHLEPLTTRVTLKNVA